MPDPSPDLADRTTDEVRAGTLVEREFSVPSLATGEPVPAVLRRPAAGEGDRLVLLGHGGRTDKRAPYIEHVAGLLAARGITSLAIDGPGHGDRRTADFTGATEEFAAAWHGGGGTAGMLGDWRAALDAVEAEFGARPTGWWGLSMGTMMGLPVCAHDERIRFAVLGLMGTWGPNRDELIEAAAALTTPVRFLVQWDDEVVPRDRCFELYGLLASRRKTMHVNPGAHAAVPRFEVAASVDYLDHHL